MVKQRADAAFDERPRPEVEESDELRKNESGDQGRDQRNEEKVFALVSPKKKQKNRQKGIADISC